MTASRLALVVQSEDSLDPIDDLLLRLGGWSVYRVDALAPALRRLATRAFDLVACEYDPAAGLDGVAVRTLHAHSKRYPFLLASTRTEAARLAKVLRVPFLHQPAAAADLATVLGAVLEPAPAAA